MAVLLACEAVDDFIQRAIASAGDDELAAFVMSALCDLGRISGLRGFRQDRMNSARGENAASFIEHAPAAPPAATGIGVVNQQRIFDFCGHYLSTLGMSRFLPSSFYIMSSEIELSLLQRVSWPKPCLFPSRKRSNSFARSSGTTNTVITSSMTRRYRTPLTTS